MTYTYDWSDQYATGIEIIDEQHRRLFGYLRDLDDAMKRHDEDGMGLMIRSLLEYAISHCAFEEGLMERGNYPCCEQHRHAHDLFRARAASYVQRLEAGAERYHLAREVRSEMAIWISGHIDGDDQDYVPWVQPAVQDRSLVRRMLDRIFSQRPGTDAPAG